MPIFSLVSTGLLALLGTLINWPLVVIAWAYISEGTEPPAPTPEAFPTYVSLVAKATGTVPLLYTDSWYPSYKNIYARCKGSPHADVALVFPSKETLQRQYDFGTTHLHWLEDQQELYPFESHWSERITDMHMRLHIYDVALAVAVYKGIKPDARVYIRDPSLITDWAYRDSMCRENLRDLEALIGDDLYLGILPPVVPSEAFRRIP